MLKKLIILLFIIPSFSYANNIEISQDSLLAAGLKELQNKNIIKAVNFRHKLITHSLNSDILTWVIALAGLDNTPTQELSYALTNLPNWPQVNIIKANYERIAYNELLKGKPLTKKKYDLKPYITAKTAKNFVAFFDNNPPKTTQGLTIYIASAIINKNLDKALPFLRKQWRYKIFTPDEQNIILATSENLLSPIDHLNRMRMLLLHHSFASATQIASLAQSKNLAEAFINIINNKNTKDLTLLKKLDKYGILYNYAYIHNAINNKNYVDAANQLTKLPQENNFLIAPNIWANLHLSLAHDLIYAQKPILAYKMITLYHNKNKHKNANREFYAGWIALRKLNKTAIAIKHFVNIKKYNKDAISLTKANYWLGRSYECLKNHNLSTIYYKKAAIYSNIFYGQLSAAHLPTQKFKLYYPIATNNEKNSFNNMEAVQALRKLQYLSDKKYSRILSLSLAYNLKNKGHLAFLTSIESSYGDYYAALKIAKIATMRGFNMGILTHPLGSIDDSIKMTLNEKALTYAIARQESEFNAGAISKAGATGLMQLMPKTAKELAQHLMKKFSLKKLLYSPSYNAKLGAELLHNHLKQYNGSYLLTFAAYNAGKYRVSQWITKYGNPRHLPLDKVLDWIENIPYAETRTYTKRVFENYETYKAILTGKVTITKDLTI